MMLRFSSALLLLALACSNDSSDESTSLTTEPCTGAANCTLSNTGGDTTAEDGTTAAETSAATPTDTGMGTESATTVDPVTTDPGTGESTGGELDCTAPTDCASCWECAKTGPCMGAYQGCIGQLHCSPTLSCVNDNCPEVGVTPECVEMCCFSCQMLGTCDGVNGTISCIAQQCAGLCGTASC